MSLAALHFLRPAWLLAIVPLSWWAWHLLRHRPWSTVWQRACDTHLLQVLLADDGVLRRWPVVLAWAGAVASVIALAGPSWQQLAQPVFESGEARVLVFDLSRSMDAEDLKPSRLASARFVAADLVRRLPPGRFGLVVFAGHAYRVLPLTTDRRSVLHLLGSLGTDLMPVQGGNVAEGITLGQRLLEDGAALHGNVILFTDSEVRPAARVAAGALVARGHRLAVVGVGTAAGAPIPTPDGPLRDRSGNVVRPVLDEPMLLDLAAAGGGRYVRLAQALELEAAAYGALPRRIDSAREDSGFHSDAWRDEGRWLLLGVLPLAAFAFRRGWAVAACLVAGLAPPMPAHADDWTDLWRNRNQIAVEQYEAGDYAAAAATFGRGDSAVDHYNRGNALAHLGRIPEAISAYDAALKIEPGFKDARFNRELLARMLPATPSGRSGGDAEAAIGLGAGSAERPGPGGSDPAGNGTQAGAESGATSASGEGRRDAGDEGSRNEPSRDAPSATRDPTTARAGGAAQAAGESSREDEQTDAAGRTSEEWLRLVQDDPGGLLRRKFRREQERRGPVPAVVEQPW